VIGIDGDLAGGSERYVVLVHGVREIDGGERASTQGDVANIEDCAGGLNLPGWNRIDDSPDLPLEDTAGNGAPQG
jgi:hypothetical protein